MHRTKETFIYASYETRDLLKPIARKEVMKRISVSLAWSGERL
jgi:hypothetical protein